MTLQANEGVISERDSRQERGTKGLKVSVARRKKKKKTSAKGGEKVGPQIT